MADRICSKCGKSKPETEEFFRRRSTTSRGGLRPDCRDCSTERDRGYHAANREKRLAAAAKYRSNNQAAIRDREAAYMATETGRAARRRATKAFNASPAGLLIGAMSLHRRRAKAAGLKADLTVEQWHECLRWFKQSCAYCGSTDQLTQEHVLAGSLGGPYTASNIIVACLPCNVSKLNTDMETWFRQRPSFTIERLARIHAYLKEPS